MADHQPSHGRETRSVTGQTVADARQAERDAPTKVKGGGGSANKLQIYSIFNSVVGTGKPGGVNTAIVHTYDSARKALCDGVPQVSYQEPATEAPGWIYKGHGIKNGKNGAHEMAARSLQWMGEHFGVDVLYDGMFKAPGPGVRAEDYIPVKSLTQYLRENGLTQEEVEDFILSYAQPDSVKEGEGKTKKKKETKHDKKVKKTKAGGAAAGKSSCFSAVPMRGADADVARKRDLDAFLAGCQPETPSNALTLYDPDNRAPDAPIFGAAPARDAADTTHLTEEEQQQRALVQADYKDAVEAHQRALLEHATQDLKKKTEALKRSSWDLADPTAPAAPATPTQDRSINREDTPTTPGIERSWSVSSAAVAQMRTGPEMQTVTPVVLHIDGKGVDYISSDGERAVVTLFATQLTRQQPLAQTIIGGIARSIETIGVGRTTLAIKFFVAPHSVAQWSATFGDGTSSTTAVFIDNSTRVRLLVLDNCQL